MEGSPSAQTPAAPNGRQTRSTFTPLTTVDQRPETGENRTASRDKAGVLEILVVIETGVVQSRDNGATFTPLTS